MLRYRYMLRTRHAATREFGEAFARRHIRIVRYTLAHPGASTWVSGQGDRMRHLSYLRSLFSHVPGASTLVGVPAPDRSSGFNDFNGPITAIT